MIRFMVSSALFCITVCGMAVNGYPQEESKADRDARMQWWREARFGLFIHWGLYALPAGAWGGKTEYGEWIRTSAQIPLRQYDSLLGEFNPVRFDPDAWARMAKDAGMKYIVITSKHHDGFCLFDSQHTEFDVMSTPFRRDIMKALADACRRAGLRICWYHSIMDWHHPDYLPRRDWEKDRPTAGADFDRYVAYMKAELKELLTNYGEIGVLWFDGEWESTWNTRYGKDLYAYVRSLQPRIIINNRVGAGRSGMEGFTKEGEFSGDFGTPEQEIPSTGLPGVDWETCMTMNDHWGYNSHDANWKSATDLIQKLAEITSKGGNFLLNVGPTSEGLFPGESIDRLREIGSWMNVNGESITGTLASPFSALPWGRCTQRERSGGTRLYLHVFEWPADARLRVPGIFNAPAGAFLLADASARPLPVARDDDALVVTLPPRPLSPHHPVVVLDIQGVPDISEAPTISADAEIFVDTLDVTVASGRENIEIRYSTDATVPTIRSPLVTGPVHLAHSTEILVRAFRHGKAVSPVGRRAFRKVSPRPAVAVQNPAPGVAYAYYEGDWDSLPQFSTLVPVKVGTTPNFDFGARREMEHFGFEYTGFLRVPRDGVYHFSTDSDDGSRVFIDDSLVVDNDGLHGLTERRGVTALAAGMHAVRVAYFEKSGSDDLTVSWSGPGLTKERIPDTVLFHAPNRP